MNSKELNKILDMHQEYLSTYGKSGSNADLRYANLRYAYLGNADLRYANLSGADLSNAYLRYANLSNAILPELTFIITGEKYFISICKGEYVRAGCQCHTIEEWFSYSKREVAEMDGKRALKFYPRLLDIINSFVPNSFKKPEWVEEE